MMGKENLRQIEGTKDPKRKTIAVTNGVTRVTFTRNSVQADWRIRKGRERTE